MDGLVGLDLAGGDLSRLWLGWLLGGLLTLPLEWLLRPSPRFRLRPWPAWCLQAGLWTLLFAALLLLTRRPLFAAGGALAFHLLVVLVNNAKYRALQEPFLFSDFGLFSQALRHPRLYLPFLGIGPGLIAIAAATGSIYVGLSWEPSLVESLGHGAFLATGCALLLLGATMLWAGTRYAPPPSLLPHDDLHRLGLAASLWLYWRLERRHTDNTAAEGSPFAIPSPPSPPARRPDIVAVQSESFFDARRLSDQVRAELLAHFDTAVAGAVWHGGLAVPAWGANTMRTEFGFLTGITADRLGVHRFNPYRRFARRALPTLASRLRALGYRTVCIHPHPASFFSRDQVYPHLGFDEFIDIRAFDRSDTCGPYICDAAVTRMIETVLRASDRPVFVFAITMENHGPLHLERPTAADVARLYRDPPPAGFDDLTVYLRHLVNADGMLGELTGMLAARPRDGLLCWFGDHVPSMPDVYAATGFTDGRTDYLIWRRDATVGRQRDLAVEALGPAVLVAAGFPPDDRPPAADATGP